MVGEDFILFEDGTKISRTFISGMYVRLMEEPTVLSYKALLEENPRNVWVIPLLIAADKSVLTKILQDADPGDELEALRRLKSE